MITFNPLLIGLFVLVAIIIVAIVVTRINNKGNGPINTNYPEPPVESNLKLPQFTFSKDYDAPLKSD